MAGLGQDMAFHHRRQLSQLRRKQRGDRWRFWISPIIGTKGELDRGIPATGVSNGMAGGADSIT